MKLKKQGITPEFQKTELDKLQALAQNEDPLEQKQNYETRSKRITKASFVNADNASNVEKVSNINSRRSAKPASVAARSGAGSQMPPRSSAS